MTNVYNVTVNPNKSKVVDTGYTFSQGDFGFQLAITVEELDTTGTSCKIGFRKTSGAVEATGLTASGQTYTYTMRGTELDVPGPVVADLKFINSTTQRISTASFIFYVVEDTLNGLTEEAHSYSDSVAQMRAIITTQVKNDLSPVQTIAQSLTEAEKVQARANIGIPSAGFNVKGTVTAVSSLPASARIEDVYIVAADGHMYARNYQNNAWVDIGTFANTANTVQYVSQSLTTANKTTARTNIEALGIAEADEMGINLFHERMELGELNATTGELVSSTSNLRSKGYIPVIGNAAYYFKTQNNNVRVCWYTENKTFISCDDAFKDSAKTAPANAAYMLFRLAGSYGTTYNHDICINRSNPIINGNYYPLSGLRKMIYELA